MIVDYTSYDLKALFRIRDALDTLRIEGWWTNEFDDDLFELKGEIERRAKL